MMASAFFFSSEKIRELPESRFSTEHFLKITSFIIAILQLSFSVSDGQARSEERFLLTRTEKSNSIYDRETGNKFTIPPQWTRNESVDQFSEVITKPEKIYMPYFKAGKNRYVLIFSRYSMAGKFASGADIFITYNPQRNAYDKLA